MADLEVLLVDVGETLIYPEPPVEQQYLSVAAQLLPEFRLPSPRTVRRRFKRTFQWLYRSTNGHCFGTTISEGFWFWQRVVASVFPRLDGEQLAELTARVFQHFLSPNAWSVFSGARPALESLRNSGLRLAVLSNWDRRARRLLSNLELSDYFERLFISSEVGYHKPDKKIFFHVLETLQVDPQQCCMIGNDVAVDMRPAASIGLHTLRFRYPTPVQEPWSPAVDNWAGVKSIIEQQFLASNS